MITGLETSWPEPAGSRASLTGRARLAVPTATTSPGCRLDLVLLFVVATADVFLTAYEAATGVSIDDGTLWDDWALARSSSNVVTLVDNYAPLGRADLTADVVRRRHGLWTNQRLAYHRSRTNNPRPF